MDLPENVPGGKTVAPLLFMTFIENAFKHGISYKKVSEINISLRVENDKIHFICSNTKPDKNEKKQTEGGVGLTNTRRRLELLPENVLIYELSRMNTKSKWRFKIRLSSEGCQKKDIRLRRRMPN